jgi:hypothetical protein
LELKTPLTPLKGKSLVAWLKWFPELVGIFVGVIILMIAETNR